MGTGIKGAQMPEEKRKMILKVFSKLKQQVIWKWETETMPDLPRNVKLIKWAPQQDLLGHKDIKLFITHCGGGSTEEAIYHGVPLIGIPVRFFVRLSGKYMQKFYQILRCMDICTDVWGSTTKCQTCTRPRIHNRIGLDFVDRRPAAFRNSRNIDKRNVTDKSNVTIDLGDSAKV